MTATQKQLAEECFAKFVLDRVEWDQPAFESLCREHPELSEELLELGRRRALPPTRRTPSVTETLREPEPSVSLHDRTATTNPFDPSAERYEERGEISRGGMGAILSVWDRHLRRNLAKKVILTSTVGRASAVSNSTMSKRFLEEAQITGQLEHPGIIPVHDLGIDGEGRQFFTMRLVRGKNLAAIFKAVETGEDDWNQTRALGVLLRVCETVAYAHSKSVIHRDLKPANVMVGRFGEVYVMDWGIAKVKGMPDRHDLRIPDQSQLTSIVHTERAESAGMQDDAPLVTMDGMVVGTPAFMSPEQALGRIDDIDVRTDVYALGAMLYQLLTGQVPYVPPGVRLSPRTILIAVVTGPPKSLRELAPDTPPELAAICEKAMSRDQDRRYANMLEMAEDLRAFLEHRVVRAYRTGPVVEFRKWVLRHKWQAGGTAAVFLLVVGAALAAFVIRVKAVENERLARSDYVSTLRAAEGSLIANDISSAKALLLSCAEEYRGWEWRHLQLATDTSTGKRTGPAARSSPIAFDALAGCMLWQTEDHRLRLEKWDGTPIQAALHEIDRTVPAAAFSAGAKHLAIGTSARLIVTDLSSGASWTADGHASNVQAICFSPDRRLVASGDGTGSVRVFDVATGKRTTEYPAPSPPTAVKSLCFFRGGESLAVGFNRGQVRILGLDATGARTSDDLIAEQKGAVLALACDPAGRRLAWCSIDKSVCSWDAASRATTEYFGHDRYLCSLAFSPDGARLVGGSLDMTLREWKASSGELLQTLRGHDNAVTLVSYCDDGRMLISGSEDMTTRTWIPALSSASRVLVPKDVPSRAMACAISDDSRRAALASATDVVVWSLTDPKDTHWSFAEKSPPTCVSFSRDGTRLFTGTRDGHVQAQDSLTGEHVVRFPALDGAVRCIAPAADRLGVLTASEKGPLVRWSVEGVKQREIATTSPISCVVVTLDGTTAWCGTREGTVLVVDVETLQVEKTLRCHKSAVRALALSADGSLLATGSDDMSIKLWDLPAETCRWESPTPLGAVVSLVLDPAEERLYVGSFDRPIRVYDIQLGKTILTLRGHERGVVGLRMNAERSVLASASMDGTVRLWDTCACRHPSRE